MNHIDSHIHLEQGEYTLEWITEFVMTAVSRGLDEIWLLEHCYRFRKFVPMYAGVCAHSLFIDEWFRRKAGILELADYLRLIEAVRGREWPIRIKFGLEVCYFKEAEDFVRQITAGLGLDFLTGSVHFVDDWAFDHRSEHWEGIDIDRAYRRYFETSIDLAESGLYNGIAHPDCIKLFGHKPTFSLDEYYDRLASALAKNRMYAEQSGGIFRRLPETASLGMHKDLRTALQRYGVTIHTASDAHCPADVGLHIEALTEALHE